VIQEHNAVLKYRHFFVFSLLLVSGAHILNVWAGIEGTHTCDVSGLK